MKPSVYEQIYGKRSWIYLGLVLSLMIAGLCLWNRFRPSWMSAPTKVGNAPLVLPASTPGARPKEPVEPGLLPPAVAQGPAQPARTAETPVIPAGTDDLIYRVQSGNCLWRIAERHCGAGFRWPEIYRANGPEIVDPDLIYPGQELQLPCGK